MCDLGRRLAAAVALGALLGGCAPMPAPAPGDTAVRPPATEGPTNFASPQDIMQRYPTMRRQQL